MKSATALLPRSQAERDRLVEQYLPLVRYVVARLPITLPGMLDRDDFYSVGVIGLMHAATTFDPSRGASFKTFAYTAIRGAILDEIRKHDPVPRGRRDRVRKLDKAYAAMRADLDREPTMSELAAVLGCTEADLDADLQAMHTCRTLSLHDGGDDGDDGPNHQFADARSPDPMACADQREAVDRLTKAISELPETERHVVVLYYHEQLYLKEIGRILGVTESRISQILTRATERMRLKLGQGD